MIPPTVRRAVRLSLLAAAIPTLVLGAEQADNTAADEVLEELVVTGSRISRAAVESPNPVLTITAMDIAQSGQTNLTQFLADTPQLVGSITTTDSSGSFAQPKGINLLNLRNLGTDRTLVLVNGRRHIAGVPGSAAVDINSIPTALLERIDVLTGGVSAIYGADGVSGVVNFVTRRDFEGLQVHGQYGVTGEGDGDNRFLAVTGGKNFAAGRGNVALAYEFTNDAAVHGSGRAQGGDPRRSYGFAFNPDDPDDEPGLFDRVPFNDLRWAGSSVDGAIDVDGDLVADFRGGGQPYDLGQELGSGLTRGGSSTPLAGYQGDLQAKTRKHVLNLLGSFELTDSANAFFEGKYATTKTWNLSQPTFEVFDVAQADNPLIPTVIRSAIAPGALDTLFRDFGIIEEDDPQVIPDGVLITRDNYDLGTKGDTVTRDTLRSVLGVDGRLLDKAKYELSYTFGQSKIAYDQPGHRINERFFAALDAVDQGQFLNGTPNGNIRCRIDLQPTGTQISPYNVLLGNLVPGGDGSGAPRTFTPGANSGCIPLNLFGEGLSDPEALEWIGHRIVDRAKVQQHVVSGSLSGDTAGLFELPGGALGWAAGAEYRKEKSINDRDPILEQDLLWGYANVSDETGSFNVKETFAEVTLPLLRDYPAAKAVTLGAAVRFSDYSTVGNTTTWKTDLSWLATEQFGVRGTYSEAVRAPNIGELYAPRSGVFEIIYDPCDIVHINEGSDPTRRQANCADILGALGVNPATFNPDDNQQFASTGQLGRAGGNASLLEEKAKTWTAGLTIRPAFTPGLSMALDWYDIKLTNAISTAEAQDVINLCVDSPRPNNYCDSVTRLTAPAGTYGTGFISSYLVGPQNVAQFATSGLDISVKWSFMPVPEWGRFQLKSYAGYVDTLTFVALPGATPKDEREGKWAPKWTLTSDLEWRKGALMLDYGLNYFSKTLRFDRGEMASQPDIAAPQYLWFKPKVLHDLQAAWQWNQGVMIYGGVNNLFDAKPAFDQTSYPNGWEGRMFYAGASIDVGAMR